MSTYNAKHDGLDAVSQILEELADERAHRDWLNGLREPEFSEEEDGEDE